MHRWLIKIAKTMAILGALVLVFLIIMTCVSVIGRELNALLNSDFIQTHAPSLAQSLLDAGIGPILGDFELLENLMPFSIYAFFPLAQIHSSHATVDVFTSRFSASTLRWIRAITEVVFALVLVLFAYKLFDGMQSKMRYGETTYLIQFPVWWSYAAAVGAATIAAVVGILMAWMCVVAALTGRVLTLDTNEVALNE